MGGRKKIELSGQRFGRLFVLNEGPKKNGQTQSFWECVCDCGKHAVVAGENLRKGKTKSCGCLRKEFRQTHKNTSNGKISLTYSSWSNMIRRCASDDYYLKNNIKVCERWLKFENFLSDMGPRPNKLMSIDRVDGRENYSPENCRWASKKLQAINRKAKGYYWSKQKKGWVSEIITDGKKKCLGIFDNPESAHNAYIKETEKRMEKCLK